MGFTQPSLHLRLTWLLLLRCQHGGYLAPPDEVCPGKQASAHNFAHPGVECMSKPGLVYPKSRAKQHWLCNVG